MLLLRMLTRDWRVWGILGVGGLFFVRQQLMPAVTSPVLNDVATDFELLFPKQPPSVGPVPQSFRKQIIATWGDKLAPLVLPSGLSLQDAFEAALLQAQEKGWSITEVDRGAAALQAVSTTRIMRFKDDVVIRVSQPTAGGPAQVDMRSRSRVGKGDLGANAARIIDYLNSLRQATDPSFSKSK